MTQCRLCEKNGKLVKAHVIPEAFFREMRVGDEIPLLISGTPNTFPKQSPIGVYDQKILCNQCEPKFDQVDDYGVQVLLNRLHEIFLPITRANRIVAYQTENINQDLLLRFLVATLWRASVSTQAFYNRIDLGPLETLARQTILNPNNPVPKQFSAVLSRWTTDEKSFFATKGLMDPFPEKSSGVNLYRFYFGEVVAYIKADTLPFPNSFRTIALLEQSTVLLFVREISKSKDFAAMIHTVEQSHKNYEEVRRTHPKKLG